jgi:lipopolysaccharide transport protein LptA
MKIFCLIMLLTVTSGSWLRAQTNTDATISVTATNKLKAAPAAPRPPTQIFSDSWDYYNMTRQMIYRGHVRVDDPQMKLTCAQIVADLPPSGGRMNHIVAETNVMIDFTDDKGQTNHATSDKAVYNYNVQGMVTNETVTLSGHASVTNADGSWIKGEPIIWDRANNSVHAENEQMSINQNISNVMGSTNSPAANTNKLSAPK